MKVINRGWNDKEQKHLTLLAMTDDELAKIVMACGETDYWTTLSGSVPIEKIERADIINNLGDIAHLGRVSRAFDEVLGMIRTRLSDPTDAPRAPGELDGADHLKVGKDTKFTICVDEGVPTGEAHFYKGGKLAGKITNLEKEYS